MSTCSFVAKFRQDLAARHKHAAPRSHLRTVAKRLTIWLPTCLRPGVTLGPMAGELERYMDLLSARQKLVASNIANADTPGYQTQDIDFQTRISKRDGRAARGRRGWPGQ